MSVLNNGIFFKVITMAMTKVLVAAIVLLVAMAILPARCQKGLSRAEREMLIELRKQIDAIEDDMQ